MKCPLLRSKQVNYGEFGRGEREYFLDCIQKECAWWNVTYKECSITMVSLLLNLIRLDTMRTRGTSSEGSSQEQRYRDI